MVLILECVQTQVTINLKMDFYKHSLVYINHIVITNQKSISDI